MTHSISVFSQLDPDTKRKRALAKVYRLLIRLAEEAENQETIPDLAAEDEESTVKPTPVQLELLI